MLFKYFKLENIGLLKNGLRIHVLKYWLIVYFKMYLKGVKCIMFYFYLDEIHWNCIIQMGENTHNYFIRHNKNEKIKTNVCLRS